MVDIQIAQERVPERDFSRGKRISVIICIILMHTFKFASKKIL